MIKVPAHALQPGDVIGSGETVSRVIVNSINWPSNKVMVELYKGPNGGVKARSVLWGKHTMIGVKREEKA